MQNERDRISRKPVEEQDKKFGLTTQLLLSAEILSRPAQSPPGMSQNYSVCTFQNFLFIINFILYSSFFDNTMDFNFFWYM